MAPTLTDQLRAAADALDALQRQREEIDARYRETQATIQRLALMVAGGGVAAADSSSAATVPADGDAEPVAALPSPDETRSDVAMRVVRANPGAHYSAYVESVYGEDTPKNRERLRAVLSDLGKRGQLRSLGNGQWAVGPTPRQHPPVAPEGSWTARALELLRQHPAGLSSRGFRELFPGDKKHAQALYSAAYQLAIQGVVGRRAEPDGTVFVARDVPPSSAPGDINADDLHIDEFPLVEPHPTRRQLVIKMRSRKGGGDTV